MKPRDFFDKVVKMREAQRQYFKTRKTNDLIISKQLEAEIDAEIARVNKILSAQEATAALKQGNTTAAAAALVNSFKI